MEWKIKESGIKARSGKNVENPQNHILKNACLLARLGAGLKWKSGEWELKI